VEEDVAHESSGNLLADLLAGHMPLEPLLSYIVQSGIGGNLFLSLPPDSFHQMRQQDEILLWQTFLSSRIIYTQISQPFIRLIQ
jgi:hypothetical protein